MECACGETVVQVLQGGEVTTGTVEIGQQRRSCVLFFNLLVDEPLEAAESREVFLFKSEPDKPVDHLRNLLFVIESVPEHIQRRIPILRNAIDRKKDDLRSTVVHVILEYPRMVLFFLELNFKPVCDTIKTFVTEICTHRQIKVS